MPAVDCNLIEEGLYQGARPSRGLPDDAQAVLNLEFDRVYDYDRDEFDPEAPNIPKSKIVAYAEMPIHDMDFPGQKWLQMAVDQVAMWRQAGLTVYVHCTAGISRSTMVVAAYLMKTHNWSASRAIEHIQSKRHEAYPNQAFRYGLKEYQEYLVARRSF